MCFYFEYFIFFLQKFFAILKLTGIDSSVIRKLKLKFHHQRISKSIIAKTVLLPCSFQIKKTFPHV